MSGAIAGYVAYRFGEEVGTGTTREAAYIDAWTNGMRLEVEVLPVGAKALMRAKERIEGRTWHTELELVNFVLAGAIEGADPRHIHEIDMTAEDLDTHIEDLFAARRILENGRDDPWFGNHPFPMRGGAAAHVD